MAAPTPALSPVALQVLAVVHESGPHPAAEVGRLLGMDAEHARSYLRRLEVRGLVDRVYTGVRVRGGARVAFQSWGEAAAVLAAAYGGDDGE